MKKQQIGADGQVVALENHAAKPKRSEVTVKYLSDGVPDIYVHGDHKIAWITFDDGSRVSVFYGNCYNHVRIYAPEDAKEVEITAIHHDKVSAELTIVLKANEEI